MNKFIWIILSVFFISKTAYATSLTFAPSKKISIIGGGITGALEAYYAHKDAEKEGKRICVTIYEQETTNYFQRQHSRITSLNVVSSLTPDEIIRSIPRGSELLEKLATPIKFGGMRVDDPSGINNSETAIKFKESVAAYSTDKNHDDRTSSLLLLGKKSMDLWESLYNEGDDELKAILELSNFKPCREPKDPSNISLNDGYRIDLIYGRQNAHLYALDLIKDYENLGYKNCKILTAEEALNIDPYLEDFCNDHTDSNRIWKNDSVALWRPGGCIDMIEFLPRFYNYLKKIMGDYRDSTGGLRDCFQIRFGSEVVGVSFDSSSDELCIRGLELRNGTCPFEHLLKVDSQYIFCPGGTVGTLESLGFNEPVCGKFTVPMLLISASLKEEQIEKYKNLSHCMSLHSYGDVLSYQGRFEKEGKFNRFGKNRITIVLGGMKAFYGDENFDMDDDFVGSRNIWQLNILNNVFPEFISLASQYKTYGLTIKGFRLFDLVMENAAYRWAGNCAVSYDGYPTLGSLYHEGRKVANARCTTHLGLGGISVGPGAVYISRCSERSSNDEDIEKILKYADSRRVAK